MACNDSAQQCCTRLPGPFHLEGLVSPTDTFSVGTRCLLPRARACDGHIDRKVYDTMSPATGEKLASTVQGTDEDVNLAVDSAKKAFATWGKTPGHVRARHLYSIARHVQKHARLIAVIEALDNGKPIRETRDADVQVVARHLYHYAGWAQLMETEMRDWQPCGVVGGIVAWNFPLMLLVWKIAPALAAGNTVVMKPATYTRLSALLFAEICNEAGLPPGVFNVVTGSGRLGSALAGHPDVDKVGGC